MHDILDIDLLRLERNDLQQKLSKYQSVLTGFAGEGASMSREGVLQARNGFGMTQFEIIVRTHQIDEFENGIPLPGSMQRAFDLIDELGI